MAKCDFPRLFKDPFDQVCSPFRVKQSFHDAGICPFDSSRISLERLNPSDHFTLPGTSNSSVNPDSESSSSSPSSCCHGDGSTLSSTVTDSNSSNSPLNNTPPQSNTTPRDSSSVVDTNTNDCGLPTGRGTPIANPLVAAVLIPKRLEDLLQVPQRKLGGTRTRVITKARVITSDEYMEELARKEEEAKEKEAAKQKSKGERESEKKRKNSSVKRNSERITRLRKQRNPLQSELHLAKR